MVYGLSQSDRVLKILTYHQLIISIPKVCLPTIMCKIHIFLL